MNYKKIKYNSIFSGLLRMNQIFGFSFRTILFCCTLLSFAGINAQSIYPDIVKNKKGEIQLSTDSLGNKIPDFSYSGYKSASTPIPNAEVKIFVPGQQEDATQIIQNAIDYLAKLKPDNNGIKGAVLLGEGVFNVSGTIYIKSSGIVLRGSGNRENQTVIFGKGIKRKAVIMILGEENRNFGDTLKIKNKYVPSGSSTLQVENSGNLKIGDQIIIQRPFTENWIQKLGMEEFGGETDWIGWKSDDFDIHWDRQIKKIEGNTITFDSPITTALDPEYGLGNIIPYTWPGRIEQVGIENLLLKSDYDISNQKDEQHRWQAISMQNVQNAWVRQVNFKHFAGGAVSLLNLTKQITVEDCKSLEPVSEIAGFRRFTFYTEGQQTLFQRCYSEYGYHDFAVGGYGTAGPNAFVQCESRLPFSYSGAIGSWASGILFDIVTIDGNALSLKNHGQDSRGIGWTAANSVIWESSASKIESFSPPTAQNWAFGVWGEFAGDGQWKEANSHIKPHSLYYALLEKRLGKLTTDPQILELGSEPSSSPTIESAEELTILAENKMESLEDWIDKAGERNPISITHQNAKNISQFKLVGPSKGLTKDPKEIRIVNGWIVANDQLITGSRAEVPWWRGSLRKSDLKKAKPHITRFVPGHIGLGYTDNLEDVVSNMTMHNVAAIEHNYGLWYDRRMDDHERVRRVDPDAWPPFYEQPFARSGEGLAWDHLSKYDLTHYNDWYWDRLKCFADLAEKEGKILINQQYFQHNIIEAGAHWASSPWRPANNINNTGFPEPPPYAGDKRIFFSKQFYDINHPVRRKLHEQFIRKGLENFKDNSNVIQLTSAEFTGPLHFMQFWLDVVNNFQLQSKNQSLIGLSATKDVQDAILKDSKRSKIVDVIDIRYWYYKQDGEAYAPEGGKNLAPRQHARKMETGKETDEQVYRAVKEYRLKYPEKAVMYSTNASGRFGWASLMGGGSLAAIPKIDLPQFYTALPKMEISENGDSNIDNVWTLENSGSSYLFYFGPNSETELDLSVYKGSFEIYWIDPEMGNMVNKEILRGGEKHELRNSGESNKLALIIKK